MTTSKGWLSIVISIVLHSNMSNAAVSFGRNAEIRTLTNGKGVTLSINSNSRIIILRKPGGYLVLTHPAGNPVYNFVSTDKRTVNQLIFKREPRQFKVGFYQFQNDYDYSVCTPEDSLSKLASDMQKITSNETIEGKNSEASILDKSCNEKLDAFGKVQVKKIAEGIAADDSYLQACLSDLNAKNKFSKIKNFQENIDLITNELANDRGRFLQGKAPFTIACEQSDIPAKYNAKFKDGVITIPVNKNKFIKNDCLSQKAVLSHELLHKAGIKSEKHVAIFDAICSSVNNPELVNDEKCSNQYTMKRCIKSPEACGAAAQMATTEALKKAERADQKKVATVVKQEIEKTSIKDITVSEKDWNTLATDTVESNTVTRGIASTMSENYDKFSGAVNRTVGIIESPAYASSSSDSSDGYSSSTATSSSTRSRYVSKGKSSLDNETMYTTEEYLADKFPDIPKSTNQLKLSTNSKSSTTSNVIAVNNTVAIEPGDQKSIVTTKENATQTAKNLAKGDIAEVGIGQGAAPNVPTAGVSLNSNMDTSSTSTRQRGSASRGLAQVQTSKTITTLQTNEVVTGSAYKEITSSYDRPTFSRELAEQGVSITISAEGITLGQKLNQASLKFVDDGKSLKRIKGK